MTEIRKTRNGGFTLLELLVALAILAMAFTIIASTFFSTTRAWRRGGELLEELHNGDFVMEQLVTSLRSAAFFPTSPELFGFWLDPQGGAYPQDEISWVTSGTTFLLPDSELANGLYRVMVSIEDNEEGEDSVAVRAFPYMAEDIEPRDVDPWFISSRVKGLECRTYNTEDEYWEHEWEDTNALPNLVEITLYMEPIDDYGPPVTIQRLVEIPLAPAVSNAVTNAEAPVTEEAGTEAQPSGGQPASGTGRTPGSTSGPNPGAPQ